MNILCLGDSITYGYEMEDGLSYPSQLQVKLPEYTVYNKGINGDTSQGVLSRLSTEIAELHPNFIILCIGINDLTYGIDTHSIQANILTALRHIKYYQAHPILLLGPNFEFALQKEPQISALCSNQDLYQNYENLLTRLEESIQSMNIDLMDCRNILHHSDFLEDGLHPNKYGYQKIADNVFHFFNKISS